MTRTRKAAFGDLALCAAVAIAAALLLIGAAKLPPPRFDPLGSAALPRALAAIMLFFAAWIAIAAVQTLMRGSGTVVQDPKPADEVNPWRGVIVFAALMAFIAALDVFRVHLIPAATVFMAVIGFVVAGPTWRTALMYGAFGLVLSGALTWVMSNFLYVKFG
jgi:putative tricarboxylic transport membrane protein